MGSQRRCEVPDENMPPEPVGHPCILSQRSLFGQLGSTVTESCVSLEGRPMSTKRRFSQIERHEHGFNARAAIKPIHLQAPRCKSHEDSLSYSDLRCNGPQFPVSSRSYALPKGDD